MKFVIAPDSFKGSLTAKEAAQAIADGLRRIFPAADYVLVPMADGGEGTVQALVDATAGQLIEKKVTGPLGKPVHARYGLLGDGQTAVIEMAAASGIQYVNEQTRNPLVTTTYGTGELIRDAAHRGVRQIIIGLGGSATTDGGAGMAQALGIHLLDQAGRELPAGGGALSQLARIDTGDRDPALAGVKIKLAADVTNPLTGPQGAAAVFGPQKGATPAMVQTLDANLHHLARIVYRDLGVELEKTAGAGAAGGLGFGLLAFTNAEMHHGVDLVMASNHLADQLAGADYVLTGEGSLDFQTQFGKTPFGVAHLASRVVPEASVIGLAGRLGPGVAKLYECNFTALFASPTGAKSLQAACASAAKDLTTTAENIARLIKVRCP